MNNEFTMDDLADFTKSICHYKNLAVSVDQLEVNNEELKILYREKGIVLCNIAECGQKGAKGVKMSKERREELKKRSINNWKNPDFRSKFEGINNTSSDHKKYCFYHKDHGEVNIVRSDLKHIYKIKNYSHIYALINKIKFSSQGWVLCENKNNIAKNYDNELYNFIHDVYGKRFCRRSELIKEFSNLDSGCLSRLVNKKAKIHNGWKIL